MSHTLEQRRGRRPGAPPRAALDADAVRAAYRRWAGVYDMCLRRRLLGGPPARRRAGQPPARPRGAGGRCRHRPGAAALHAGQAHHRHRSLGRDAAAGPQASRRERTVPMSPRCGRWTPKRPAFPDACFDIAVAMFVASVVPHPRRIAGRNAARGAAGRHILFVNHFAAERGPRWWVERALAPASRALGWHPDFAIAGAVQRRRPSATMRADPGAAVRPVHAGAAAQLTPADDLLGVALRDRHISDILRDLSWRHSRA